jgi:hypothetical protein
VSRQYSAEELEAIVRRALDRQGVEDGFGHQELLEAARDIGVSPEEMEAAAAEVELEQDRQRWEDAARARRRGRLWSRLTAFVGLNGGLFIIDALTGAGWWFHWVLLGTGFPMSLHALRLYRPVTGREVDRERRREEREQRRHARALRRRRRPRSPAEDFEVVVERGVELLVDALTRKAEVRRRSGSDAPMPKVRVEPDGPRGDEAERAEGRQPGSRRAPGSQ